MEITPVAYRVTSIQGELSHLVTLRGRCIRTRLIVKLMVQALVDLPMARSALIAPVLCRRARLTNLVDGVRSHAATLAVRRHSYAGCPRYAQANAPQPRGLLAAPVCMTREVSNRD